MTKKELLETFKQDQSLYQHKREKLDRWKSDFQQLEKDIQMVVDIFEREYEKLMVPDELGADAAEKLENRKEGIRLSVKSAGRLLKKWNPEKEVRDSESVFITGEALAEQISQNRSGEEEAAEEPVLTAGEEAEAPLKESAQPEREELAADHEELSGGEGTGQPEDLGNQIKTNEKEEAEESKEQEENQEKLEEQSDIQLLEEAIRSNQEVLAELDQCIEQAEKRFLSFFEKAAAPVLDGLYSGKKFADDWSRQLKEENHEQYDVIVQWLYVYEQLINELKRFFLKYAIQLYVPETGSTFNEEKQEPIGVVEDTELEDEQIKEVVRFGLVYGKEIYQQDSFFIRPAQVIVVKNPSETAAPFGEEQEQ